MIITNKRTGDKIEVTEEEAKRIANNPQVSRLYNIPLSSVKAPSVPKDKQKPLKPKPKSIDEKVNEAEEVLEPVPGDDLPTQ